MAVRAMDIRLAGFNIDRDALNMYLDSMLKTTDPLEIARIAEGIKALTPESIATGYARNSRDPAQIYELRRIAAADISAARKSLTNNSGTGILDIGHNSVAEHAIFNIDVTGASRVLIEETEGNRLNAFTEGSQRYILMNGDYVIPAEIIAAGSMFKDRFELIVDGLHVAFYQINHPILLDWHLSQDNSVMLTSMGLTDEKKIKTTIEGWAKEDARYTLPMATQAQLGMTINGRNLEHLLITLNSSEIAEYREFGEKLYEQVEGIAPSLIKHIAPTDYFTKTRKELKALVNDLTRKYGVAPDIDTLDGKAPREVIVHDVNNKDKAILAGMVFSSSMLSYTQSLELISRMSKADKKEMIKTAVRYQKSHDPYLREFELTENVAEIVLSSSAFAQLKRHRMTTQILQDYDPELGVTIPKSVIGAGKLDHFIAVIDRTNEFYRTLKDTPETEKVAHYILTNAHRRRVLLSANNREIQHIASERMSPFAQWDIRNLMTQYVEQMQERCPSTLETACGKKSHDAVRDAYLNS